jgi:hypothetical protein
MYEKQMMNNWNSMKPVIKLMKVRMNLQVFDHYVRNFAFSPVLLGSVSLSLMYFLHAGGPKFECWIYKWHLIMNFYVGSVCCGQRFFRWPAVLRWALFPTFWRLSPSLRIGVISSSYMYTWWLQENINHTNPWWWRKAQSSVHTKQFPSLHSLLPRETKFYMFGK